jgi:N6-adenosine-specific RNA methylase IME4
MYNLIVVDPPWPVKKIQRKVRPNQKEMDYPTLSLAEIKNIPIHRISADNCVLFLWSIQKYLPHAFDILDNWGFKYQRTLTWDKRNGMCLFGFHHRTEFVLFGYKGKIDMYPKQKAIPTVFTGKSSRHSAKPYEFYNMIEHLGDKRLDMFARQEREGWDVFGDEVANSITI